MAAMIARPRGRTRLAGIAVAALLLVIALPGVALGHHATASCEHITIGGAPNGVSGQLTPGPIDIVPPDAQTSINGTYAVPPGTYTLTFSDHARPITNLVVTVCPAGSPTPTPTPTATSQTEPTATASPTPTPTSTTESSSPSGGVEGATGTPKVTLPATATVDGTGQGGTGSGLPFVLLGLLGISVGIGLLGPSGANRRRPSRRR